MTKNNTKNFTSFPLEKSENFTVMFIQFIFSCVHLYLKKSFTPKQYNLITFSRGAHSFSLTLKKSVVSFFKRVY